MEERESTAHTKKKQSTAGITLGQRYNAGALAQVPNQRHLVVGKTMGAQRTLDVFSRQKWLFTTASLLGTSGSGTKLGSGSDRGSWFEAGRILSP